MQSTIILAQETNIQEEATPSVTTSGARYTDDFNPEIHANFEVNYKVTSNLFFAIRGYRNKYVAQDVFGGSFFARQYLSKRLYLYSGIHTEFTGGLSLGEEPLIILSRLNAINGVGYDINKNFSIEVENAINLKRNFGGFSNQNEFLIRGKFTF